MASSTRRKAIIRDARFPKKSVVAQYDSARDAIVEFLRDDARSLDHLARGADQLAKREARAESDWVKRDSRLSAEALDAFQRAYNKLGLTKLLFSRGEQLRLTDWSTRVSVSLDLIARRKNMEGRDRVGGVIFLFSKGEASIAKRIDRGKTIAGLVLTACHSHLNSLGDPDRALCLAVDVFAGVAHSPPGTFSRKLRLVEDSCEEIATRWKTIEPPSDYDGPTPS